MKIFDYESYKDVVRDWIAARPNGGWGELTRIANHLGVHTTLLSHTINGDKDLSAEHAHRLCEYMSLSATETEFFLTLLEIERAGLESLKRHLRERLTRLRRESAVLANRVPTDHRLDESEQAIFYSSWVYAFVRQLVDISAFSNREQLCNVIPLEVEVVQRTLDFLIERGLVVEERDGTLRIGPNSTHLPKTSPFLGQHLKNCRLKGFDRHGRLRPEELMYSAVLTISRQDLQTFRMKLVELIASLGEVATKPSADEVMIFNIDWFYPLDAPLCEKLSRV